EFAEVIADLVAVLVEGGGGEAEGRRRHLTGVDGSQRRGLQDSGAHIRAAASDVEQHPVAELLEYPFVAGGRQGCSSGPELGDGGQVELLGRGETGLPGSHDRSGSYPHHRALRL